MHFVDEFCMYDTVQDILIGIVLRLKWCFEETLFIMHSGQVVLYGDYVLSCH